MNIKFRALFFFAFLCFSFAQDKPTAPPVQPQSLRMVVEVPGRDTLVSGSMELSAKGIKFQSADLLFDVPVDCIEEVLVAGFKEDFLKVRVLSDSDFAKTYDFLLKKELPGIGGKKNPNPLLKIQLWPKESLPPAMEAANAFKATVAAAQARAAERTAAERAAARSTAETSSSPASPTVDSKAVTTEAPAVPAVESKKPARKVVFRINQGGYLPSLSGTSKVLGLFSGPDGATVFFEDGIGFKSDQPKPAKVPGGFLDEDGYFKFLVPLSEVAGLRLVKGEKVHLFYVTLKDGEFLAKNRALLTDQGAETERRREIIFCFPAGMTNLYQINGYIDKRAKEDF